LARLPEKSEKNGDFNAFGDAGCGPLAQVVVIQMTLHKSAGMKVDLADKNMGSLETIFKFLSKLTA
jgi:hypothetical protein